MNLQARILPVTILMIAVGTISAAFALDPGRLRSAGASRHPSAGDNKGGAVCAGLGLRIAV